MRICEQLARSHFRRKDAPKWRKNQRVINQPDFELNKWLTKARLHPVKPAGNGETKIPQKLRNNTDYEIHGSIRQYCESACRALISPPSQPSVFNRISLFEATRLKSWKIPFGVHSGLTWQRRPGRFPGRCSLRNVNLNWLWITPRRHQDSKYFAVTQPPQRRGCARHAWLRKEPGRPVATVPRPWPHRERSKRFPMTQ